MFFKTEVFLLFVKAEVMLSFVKAEVILLFVRAEVMFMFAKTEVMLLFVRVRPYGNVFYSLSSANNEISLILPFKITNFGACIISKKTQQAVKKV